MMLTVKVKDRYSAEQAARDDWVMNLAPNAKPVNVMNGTVLGKMRAFNQFNKLKKVALQVIAQHLSDESINHLRNTFLALDVQMKGALTVGQMEEAIQQVTKEEDTQVELIEMMHEMAGITGEINYTQFIAANMDKQLYLKEEACKAAFALFDVDGDGEITREDLRLLFASQDDDEENQTTEEAIEQQHVKPTDITHLHKKNQLGESALAIIGIEHREIERVMFESDSDNSGAIDFAEFMQMMSDKELQSPHLIGSCALGEELGMPNKAATTDEIPREPSPGRVSVKAQIKRSPTQILQQRQRLQEQGKEKLTEHVAKSDIAPNSVLRRKSVPVLSHTDGSVAATEDTATKDRKMGMVRSSTVIFGQSGKSKFGTVTGGEGLPAEENNKRTSLGGGESGEKRGEVDVQRRGSDRND